MIPNYFHFEMRYVVIHYTHAMFLRFALSFEILYIFSFLFTILKVWLCLSQLPFIANTLNAPSHRMQSKNNKERFVSAFYFLNKEQQNTGLDACLQYQPTQFNASKKSSNASNKHEINYAFPNCV